MDDVEVTCDVVYKTIRGEEATLDLYLPAGTSPQSRLPAVILFHGNVVDDPLMPIRDHWKRDMYTHGLVMAASGFAAIAFDHGGYTQVGHEEWLAESEQDGLDLLAYVAVHSDDLMVDPSRMCVWTVSGGAIPGAWATLRGDPQPRCAVIISGRLDAEFAPESNPTSHITRAMPPFFIARAKFDNWATFGSEPFLKKAEAERADVLIVDHPGSHAFEVNEGSHEKTREILRDALRFLDEHLTKP